MYCFFTMHAAQSHISIHSILKSIRQLFTWNSGSIEFCKKNKRNSIIELWGRRGSSRWKITSLIKNSSFSVLSKQYYSRRIAKLRKNFHATLSVNKFFFAQSSQFNFSFLVFHPEWTPLIASFILQCFPFLVVSWQKSFIISRFIKTKPKWWLQNCWHGFTLVKLQDFQSYKNIIFENNSRTLKDFTFIHFCFWFMFPSSLLFMALLFQQFAS